MSYLLDGLYGSTIIVGSNLKIHIDVSLQLILVLIITLRLKISVIKIVHLWHRCHFLCKYLHVYTVMLFITVFFM